MGRPGVPNYRRLFAPGGCWFFTVNLQDRHSCLLTRHIDALDAAVSKTRRRHPFEMDAWVVLPDHIHAIWTLPSGDTDFPGRWRSIKTFFSKSLPPTEWRSAVRLARGERGIWQRRYWEHLIRDEKDLDRHLDYCWFNPVKHGLVERVEDWPFSTYHRDMATNPLPADRAVKGDARASFGERA